MHISIGYPLASSSSPAAHLLRLRVDHRAHPLARCVQGLARRALGGSYQRVQRRIREVQQVHDWQTLKE